MDCLFKPTLLKWTDRHCLSSFAVAASTSQGAGVNLSHSASSLSLQKAFSELRHAQVAEGPSTAPPNFSHTGPAFPVVPASMSGPAGVPTTVAAAPSVSVSVTGCTPLPDVPTSVVQAEVTVPTEKGIAGVATCTGVVTSSGLPVPPVSETPVLPSAVPSTTVPAVACTSALSQSVQAPTSGNIVSRAGTVTFTPISTPSASVVGSAAGPGAQPPPVLLPQQAAGSTAGAATLTSVSATTPFSSGASQPPLQLGSSTSAPALADTVVVSAHALDKMAHSSLPGLAVPHATLSSSCPGAAVASTAAQPGGVVQPLVIPSAVASTAALSQAAGPTSTPLFPHVPSVPPLAQPVASVPTVQQTLVHSQPQPALLPNQPHLHCPESDADTQPKAGIDDIKTLEEKLRFLFSEHGSSGAQHAAVSLDTSLVVETSVTPGIPTTAVAPSKLMTSTTSTCLPPNSLPLGTTGVPAVPVATPGQAAAPPVSAAPGVRAAAAPSKPAVTKAPVRCSF